MFYVASLRCRPGKIKTGQMAKFKQVFKPLVGFEHIILLMCGWNSYTFTTSMFMFSSYRSQHLTMTIS